ncbi:Hypothetical predicted protein [Podarcis lilfordi]|uniref:Uncharacterized protein n=1 Tax=Podarcis lilfordi TaxID=74358 RepID=A0AA35KUV0_9SAUR|nr:Hypothetical predicted protein [Podarcis lilfordi]
MKGKAEIQFSWDTFITDKIYLIVFFSKIQTIRAHFKYGSHCCIMERKTDDCVRFQYLNIPPGKVGFMQKIEPAYDGCKCIIMMHFFQLIQMSHIIIEVGMAVIHPDRIFLNVNISAICERWGFTIKACGIRE